MKNYLKEYKSKNVQKFQMGGAMPANIEESASMSPATVGGEGAAPGEEGSANLESMIAQVVETQDPNLALEVVNMIAEQAGLGAAPAMPAPGAEGIPAEIPQGKFGMKIPIISLKVKK